MDLRIRNLEEVKRQSADVARHGRLLLLLADNMDEPELGDLSAVVAGTAREIGEITEREIEKARVAQAYE